MCYLISNTFSPLESKFFFFSLSFLFSHLFRTALLSLMTDLAGDLPPGPPGKTLLVHTDQSPIHLLSASQAATPNVILNQFYPHSTLTNSQWDPLPSQSLQLPMSTPYPGPWSVVIMDNAQIHHSDEIDQLVRGYGTCWLILVWAPSLITPTGCCIEYLPPYLLDFNPSNWHFLQSRLIYDDKASLPLGQRDSTMSYTMHVILSLRRWHVDSLCILVTQCNNGQCCVTRL